MKRFILFVLIVTFALKVNSQNFGEILGRSLGQVGEAILLKKIIDNPNLQSVDMQNYLYYLNSGHQSYNSANYSDAVSYYSKASKIINSTRDQNLLKLYNNYGWGKVLSDSYNNAYKKYEASKQEERKLGILMSAYNNSRKAASGSGGNTTSVQANKCGVCHSTGKCPTCNGKGISPNSGRTCGACGGRKICVTCDGTGISGYSTVGTSTGGMNATPVQKAQKCGVCYSSGKCSTCYGRGISPNSGSICGACNGKGTCVTCNGTGISGYVTEYIYH